MAGDQSSGKHPDSNADPGANAGWVALGYLGAGMLFWGGAGWLLDRWLGWSPWGLAGGLVLGMTAGIYLILKRLG
ncbi:MAG: AtpZ/AtpI family protein [Micromonosporaceae bacterium]